MKVKAIPVEPVGKREQLAFVMRNGVCGFEPWVSNVFPPSPNGDRLRAARVGDPLAREAYVPLRAAANLVGVGVVEFSGLECGQYTLASQEQWDELIAAVDAARRERGA